MPIQPDQLATLRSFGYTEVESRFLYLVATHSGYFTVRQFLDFANAKSGKRNAHLIETLFSQGHATAHRYRRRSCVYHLHSRALYDAIGKRELRNRRNHEIRHIKGRLLALDYILAHSENEYFETAKAKWRYLMETLKVPDDIFLPEADGTEWITLPDRFPMGVSRASARSAPVVIFTYVDSEHFGLGPFIRHLRMNRRLYAALPYFEFVYVSTASKEQEEAAELFALLIQGQGLGDLLRYFDLKTKWDNRQYGLFCEDEVIFLSESRKRYTGENFAALYYLWKRNQLPKDLRAEGFCSPNCAFKLMTVCGHDAVFGTETKRWGDGWKVRGSSRTTPRHGSLRLEQQVLPTKANA
ncbi:MAG: hypothetical protein JST77_11525 [Acidobacteria bacterium]|nr:hypothetical protein [Acidobacteriota bacterium]